MKINKIVSEIISNELKIISIEIGCVRRIINDMENRKPNMFIIMKNSNPLFM